MKYRYLFVLIFSLMASAVLPAQSLGQQLQVQAACTGTWSYEKILTDLGAGTAAQTRIFQMNCSAGTASSGTETFSMSLGTEISPAGDYDCRQPAQKDYFDVTNQGGVLKATIKAGSASKTPLKYQEIHTNTKGKITFVHTRIQKDEWLYEEMTDIFVWFDAEGHYLNHTLEINTWVWLSGTQHTKIVARRLPGA